MVTTVFIQMLLSDGKFRALKLSRLESFRVLKLTAILVSFMTLKLSRLYSFRVLKLTARLDSFMALKLSTFESFRVLKLTARLESFRNLKLSNLVMKNLNFKTNNQNNLKCILKGSS